MAAFLAMVSLHKQGFAASVEVWDNETDELVGGLYGVTIGKVFIEIGRASCRERV